MRETSIGELRHRVVLETQSRSDDGGGGATVTWTAIAEMWAAIRPVGGSETVVAEQVEARASHDVVIRPFSSIAPAMRFRRENRIFEILAILDADDRGRRQRCLCREEFL